MSDANSSCLSLKAVKASLIFNKLLLLLIKLTNTSHCKFDFGANDRWGTFFSGGLGWNLHREDFFEDHFQL
ncbi:MAG: hypothetical protein P8X62_10565, partial [Flavobacteriaceae bacterium]